MGTFKTKKSRQLKAINDELSVPKDLADLHGSIEAMSVIHHLLQTGTFQARYLEQMVKSIAFMRILHEQTVEMALKHPNAEMIKELKDILDERKAKKDGKTEEPVTEPTPIGTASENFGTDQAAYPV